MVLSPEGLVFTDSDVQVVIVRLGVAWTLSVNSHGVFLVTAQKGEVEIYRNIFEDLPDVLAECIMNEDIMFLMESVAALPDDNAEVFGLMLQ